MITYEQQKRIGHLQTLCNRYGDFKIAISGKKADGETYWTKHHSVLEQWEHFEEKGEYLLANANHRQILPCEIVLDLDENPTIEKLNIICDILEEEEAKYKAYFTGSRGYHIHILEPKMMTLDPKYTLRLKEAIRERMIARFGGDLHKKSEVMIALENAPHWKTGRPKTLLRGYPHE